jgi:hypothetical protein
MKNLITLAILLAKFVTNAQCPAPSNINLVDNINLLSTVELSWTENGSATIWDIAVVPNFNVDLPLPTNIWVSATTNPFILTNIPQITGCYAFFVRSVCSATDISPWVAIGTMGCSTDLIYYLATLSNDSFNSENKEIQIFPNPAQNELQIAYKGVSVVNSIEIYDLSGRVVYTTSPMASSSFSAILNISELQSGSYVVVLKNGEKKVVSKQMIKE